MTIGDFLQLSLSELLFYVFSAITLGSALMVVFSRHPVRSILFLMLTFFTSAVLWMLLQAEFLSLALIFVYVGAVMTLFLFVVMMLNVEKVPRGRGFAILPLGLALGALFAVVVVKFLHGGKLPFLHKAAPALAADFNHTQALGRVLYTQYVLPFELAAVILLVAMVSAITLAFRGRRQNSRSQRISEQVAVQAKDRVRIVAMPAEKSSC